jgi:phospholipid/cholesterol/gamma-HCH transport system substrate-binding protein
LVNSWEIEMSEPLHRDQVKKFLVGLVVLAIIGVISWVGAIMQGGGAMPGMPYTYVTATFRNVGDLKARENVSENGTRIGQVSAIGYRNGLAVVTLRLDGKRAVYQDAHAQMKNRSALGRKVVEIDPGTPGAGPLPNNAIPLAQTKDSIALDDVFSIFDPQTRAAARSSLRQLGGGFVGHSADLHDFAGTAAGSLNDLGRVSTALSDPNARFPELLGSANTLVGRFNGHEAEISDLLRTANTTFRAVDVDHGQPLRQTLRELPPTLSAAERGLQSLDAPLDQARAAVTTLKPGAEALGQSTPDLRGFLREAVPPLDKVPGVSERANPAVDGLTHMFSDARPLIRPLSDTVASASVFLQGLSPYATDAGRLFSEHDLLSGILPGRPDQHFFSASVALPGAYNASVPDPLATRTPYPKPGGGAWRDNPAEGGGR